MSSNNNNNIDYYKYSHTTQNEIKPYTGLQLSRYKNDVATKISGPITMYILSPTKEGYQLPLSIPIMMLFGDNHASRKNECTDCKTDPTCYEIDNRLLDKLNELFSYKYPVDFYVEFFGEDYGKLNDESDSRLGSFKATDSSLLSCYGPNKKAECAYKNIRFHYADARNSKNTIENSLYNILYILHYMENNMMSKEDIKSYHFLIDIINDLINIFKTQDINSIRYAIFDYIISKSNSLIRKEFQRLNMLNDLQIWRYYFGKEYMSSESVGNIEKIRGGLELLKSKLLSNSSEYSNELDTLNIFILTTTARITDIYFLMRVFKTLTPKTGTNSNRSGLSIGYFGSKHVFNIVHFLLETNLYSIVYDQSIDYSKENNNVNIDSRCITIDRPISLFKLLADHMEKLEIKNIVSNKNTPSLSRNHVYVNATKPSLSRNHVYVNQTKPSLSRNHVYVNQTKPSLSRNHVYANPTKPEITGGRRQKKTRKYNKKTALIKKTRRYVKK